MCTAQMQGSGSSLQSLLQAGGPEEEEPPFQGEGRDRREMGIEEEEKSALASGTRLLSPRGLFTT